MREVERRVATLVDGLEDLRRYGDAHALRLIVWIAYALTERSSDDLGTDSRRRLALAASEAALKIHTPSMAALAVRVIDPALIAATTPGADVAVGDIEELNQARRSLTAKLGLPTEVGQAAVAKL